MLTGLMFRTVNLMVTIDWDTALSPITGDLEGRIQTAVIAVFAMAAAYIGVPAAIKAAAQGIRAVVRALT